MEKATPYQNLKEVKDTLAAWSSGQRSAALQQLLTDHFGDLPKREKALEKLDVLAQQFGTVFEVKRKGKVNQALRKAPIARVLEKLALYLFAQEASSLPAADDDQAEVVAALEAVEAVQGPQVAVSAAKAAQIRGQLAKLAKGADTETGALLKEIEALLKGGIAV